MNKRTKEDFIIDFLIYSFLAVTTFLFLYPFWNIIVVSFNSGVDTARGGLTFWPREFTLENYRVVFQDSRLLNAFLVSIGRTAIGTLLALVFNGMAAYALSKKDLIGRKIYFGVFIFTMYFVGGLIPTYLIIRNVGLLNSFWVMVIPFIINVYHIIIFHSFFQDLPISLEESAQIDGATYFQIFIKIIVPISAPVFATIALFTSVWHWNNWLEPVIYIRNANLLPIQAVLQEIINSNVVSEAMRQAGGAASDFLADNSGVTSRSIISSTIVVATLPIIFVYPFLQKYFVKGMTLGAIKE
jgi:putative aldouronate transport system permease protein